MVGAVIVSTLLWLLVSLPGETPCGCALSRMCVYLISSFLGGWPALTSHQLSVSSKRQVLDIEADQETVILCRHTQASCTAMPLRTYLLRRTQGLPLSYSRSSAHIMLSFVVHTTMLVTVSDKSTESRHTRDRAL